MFINYSENDCIIKFSRIESRHKNPQDLNSRNEKVRLGMLILYKRNDLRELKNGK